METRKVPKGIARVCMMKVPFSQLANAAVFAQAFGIKSYLHGLLDDCIAWCVHIPGAAEWPHEYLGHAVLKRAGIGLEQIPRKETRDLPPVSEWKDGL